MTPKQKAEDLFYEMSTNSSDEHHHCSHYVAKNCALIAIHEIIKMYNELNVNGFLKPNSIGFILDEIKQEIENL